MADLVIFDVYADRSGPATLGGRILLSDDQHWCRLPIRQPPNAWGDSGLPMLGSWCKFDESMGLTPLPSKTGLSLQEMVPTQAVRVGPVQIGSNQQNRQALSLSGFFPAVQGKQGKGRNGGDNTGLTFRIIQQSPLAGMSYDGKLQIACGTALQEMSSKKLNDKVWELFTWSNAGLFGLFIASYVLKKPTALFSVCRAALGRVLAWAMILDYCSRFGEVFDAVDRAETVDQLKQAGMRLADILLSLSRDAGLVALSELVRAFLGQKGKPVGKRGSQTTMNRTLVSSDPPPPSCEDWRTLFHDNCDLADFCLKQAKIYFDQGLFDDYALALQKAFEFRVQAHLMRVFIVETIHHVEVMKRLGELVTPLGGRIKGIMNNPITPRALKLKAIQMEVENWTAPEGYRMTPVESAQVGERFLKDGTGGRFDWSRHDCDLTDLSKFRGVIADGMKNPIKIPRGWSIDELDAAARDVTNPRTHRPFTDAELKDMFGDEYRRLQQMFGSQRALFEGTIKSKRSIDMHNLHPAATHHHPETADQLMENAHDFDHACSQDRSYRPQPLAANEIMSFAGDRLPWVKIGLASLAKLGRTYNVVDPVTAVSTVMLHNYGQAEMLQEMGVGSR
jgi:hypothetical protein